MVRKYTDVQAARDIERAEDVVARDHGNDTGRYPRALRDRAEEAGLSLHAAALAVLASDPVLSRGVPHDPGRAAVVDPARAAVTSDPPWPIDRLGTERLCVAARSVRAQMPDLSGAGVAEPDRAQLARHAEALADLDRAQTMSPAEVAAHAWVLRQTLTAIGSDRSLGLAVWFDDVLGTDTPTASPAPAGI